MNTNTFPTQPVLLVDDETQFLLSATFMLASEGINHVAQCADSRKVLPLLGEQHFSVMVLDIRMPHISGLTLLPEIIEKTPELPIILLTAINDVETAVECMKKGAFDYLVKPVDDIRLVTTIRRAIEQTELRWENRRLKQYLLTDKLERPEIFSEIVTQDRAMQSIFQYIEAIGRGPLPVLVTGETGVGKELVAKAIHKCSRRTGHFVAFNMSSIDDHLFSDALFGHVKGAFTGADQARKGLIEQAVDGTLLLDEIGELRSESQVKLLRLLEESKYYPLGSDTPRGTNARIIAATNRDIQAMTASGQFRKDLYYRLQTHHIHIPPLRERCADIPLLVEYFLERAAKMLQKRRPTPPDQLFTLLNTYDFPGNIRELEGMVLDAVSRHESGVLSMSSFVEKIGRGNTPAPDADSLNQQALRFTDRLPTLKQTENLLIDEALRRTNGNQTIAARLLGISRRALNNRLRRAR